MRVSFPYTFTENVIPKGCRKPRLVRFEDTLDVEIQEVAEWEAPVAIIEYDSFETGPLLFRWFNNTLWTDSSTFRRKDGKYTSLQECFRCDAWRTQDEVTAQLNACAENVILIDQQIFRCAGEPRYVVMTFGLGCNHGGTALMTDHSYNSNIGKSRYYRIDQRAEAIVEAERVAIARGDTRDVPIDPHSNFEIFLSESIQLDPNAEHGDGDTFMNDMEDSIQRVKNPLLSGLLGISRAFSNS